MAKAMLFYNPVIQFFDNNGVELSGGKVYFYQPGTTTLKNTYTDVTKSVANPNPVILDSAGRPDNSGTPIDIYLDGSYKVVLKTSADVTIRTVDNVNTLGQLITTTSKSSNYTVTTNDRDKLVLVNCTGGSIAITLPAVADAGDGFNIKIKKVDASANTVVIDGNSSETIDGNATHSLSGQYDWVSLICDGTQWHTDIRSSFPNSVTIANDLTVTDDASIGDDLTVGDDVAITGDITVGGTASITGNILTPVTINVGDSRTNTNATLLALKAPTSGSPAAGIGTAMTFNAESADETDSAFGALAFTASDVTAASEDTYLAVYTRTAGAALAESYRFQVTGVGNYIFTGAPTATRTVTIPDTDVTFGGKPIIQYVYSTLTSVQTGTTQIPVDDTIPQNTEGTEFITTSITPSNASNILVIRFFCPIASHSASSTIVSAALFQDTTANALAVTTFQPFANNAIGHMYLEYYMVAGTTSATTFKIRAGGAGAGTTTINGHTSARKFGGIATTTLCVFEYTP